MINVRGSSLQQLTTHEWEVVDLLLSDERVVQEMFQEIVTAEWPPTPDAPAMNRPGAGDGTAGAEIPGPPARTLEAGRQRWGQRPGTDGWARERSPPKPLPTQL